MGRTEISKKEKVIAGSLLISISVLMILNLIAFWPDRLPDPGDKKLRYNLQLFNITLLDTAAPKQTPKAAPDSTKQKPAEKTQSSAAQKNKAANPPKDSAQEKAAEKADSGNAGQQKEQGPSSGTPEKAPTGSSANAPTGTPANASTSAPEKKEVPPPAANTADIPPSTTVDVADISSSPTIHLNTLLLILVASAGFLGSMVHISSSLTNFIGAEEFKRTWLLWYFVKPFTGATVALIFYFVFRAGLLNVSDNGGSINLYGIISIAALSGLFTDKATLKLEEIFAVLFKPKDDRPDKMQDFLIEGVTPAALVNEGQNLITIKGKSLKKGKVAIKMDDEVINNPAQTDTAITFMYTVPPEKKTQTVIKMVVTDELGKEFKNEFAVKTK